MRSVNRRTPFQELDADSIRCDAGLHHHPARRAVRAAGPDHPYPVVPAQIAQGAQGGVRHHGREHRLGARRGGADLSGQRAQIDSGLGRARNRDRARHHGADVWHSPRRHRLYGAVDRGPALEPGCVRAFCCGICIEGLTLCPANQLSSFDGLVSTSNHLVPEEKTVWIRTSKPVWWTAELKNISHDARQ